MNISLLIAEDGADWVERARAWRLPANELMVLAQQRDESNLDFRARIEQRLARLRRVDKAVEQVLLVAGRRRDGSALLARAELLHLLLNGSNASTGSSSVRLDAGARDDAQAHFSIRALAQTVLEQIGDAVAMPDIVLA